MVVCFDPRFDHSPPQHADVENDVPTIVRLWVRFPVRQKPSFRVLTCLKWQDIHPVFSPENRPGQAPKRNQNSSNHHFSGDIEFGIFSATGEAMSFFLFSKKISKPLSTFL